MAVRSGIRLVALALVVAVGACESAPPASAPVAAVPDLRGTWTGSWGGAPLALVVTDQPEIGAGSGVYLGSWQVLGGRGPGLSGVLSFTVRGERISVPVVGRLGADAGRLAVLLEARGTAGEQQLRLVQVQEDRLRGSGESTAPWGPRGAAELTRATRPAP